MKWDFRFHLYVRNNLSVKIEDEKSFRSTQAHFGQRWMNICRGIPRQRPFRERSGHLELVRRIRMRQDEVVEVLHQWTGVTSTSHCKREYVTSVLTLRVWIVLWNRRSSFCPLGKRTRIRQIPSASGEGSSGTWWTASILRLIIS